MPKLYGKIEPLLGMRPRDEKTWLGGINAKVVIGCIVAVAAAVGAELLATSGTQMCIRDRLERRRQLSLCMGDP